MLGIFTGDTLVLRFELLPVISTEPSELFRLVGGLFWVGCGVTLAVLEVAFCSFIGGLGLVFAFDFLWHSLWNG